MKRKELSVVLASLLALGLVGCSSMGMGGGSEPSGTATDTTGASAHGGGMEPAPSSGSSGTNVAPGDSGTSASGSSATGAAGSSGMTGSSGTSGTGMTGSSGTSSTGGTGMEGSSSTGSMATGSSAAGTDSSMASGAQSGVVSLIEVVPMQSGAMGTTAGTGTSAGGQVYRVTLQMDDGATRIITQETAPTFKSGDRVRLSAGAVAR